MFFFACDILVSLISRDELHLEVLFNVFDEALVLLFVRTALGGCGADVVVVQTRYLVIFLLIFRHTIELKPHKLLVPHLI